MTRVLDREPRLSDRAFFALWHPVVVRHADLDPNGHVTNSVYAAWFDDGRFAHLRAVLRPLMAPGDVLALASLTIDFLAEVGFDERPEIATRVLSLGRSSMTIGQALFAGDTLRAVAHSVTVVADGTTRRAKPLGEAQRAVLLPRAVSA